MVDLADVGVEPGPFTAPEAVCCFGGPLDGRLHVTGFPIEAVREVPSDDPDSTSWEHVHYSYQRFGYLDFDGTRSTWWAAFLDEDREALVFCTVAAMGLTIFMARWGWGWGAATPSGHHVA